MVPLEVSQPCLSEVFLSKIMFLNYFIMIFWTRNFYVSGILESTHSPRSGFSRPQYLQVLTRTLDATNYANQDYMRVNYTLIVVYTMLLVTAAYQKTSHIFAWIWLNSDRRLVNHCALPSIGQTCVHSLKWAI
jgi:hypothetical protein